MDQYYECFLSTNYHYAHKHKVFNLVTGTMQISHHIHLEKWFYASETTQGIMLKLREYILESGFMSKQK